MNLQICETARSAGTRREHGRGYPRQSQERRGRSPTTRKRHSERWTSSGGNSKKARNLVYKTHFELSQHTSTSSYLYLYVPSHLQAVETLHYFLQLPPSRNSDRGSHNRHSSALPASVHAFICIARRVHSAFFSLVDSPRIAYIYANICLLYTSPSPRD